MAQDVAMEDAEAAHRAAAQPVPPAAAQAAPADAPPSAQAQPLASKQPKAQSERQQQISKLLSGYR
jgi:hypothetical protein